MSCWSGHSEAPVVWRGTMKVLLLLVSVLGLFGQYHLTPLPQDEHDESIHPTRDDGNDLSMATKYLQRFYSFQTDPAGRRRRSRPSFSSTLKDMQSFFRLNQTGTLNPSTLAVMRTPRCGVSDVEEYSHRRGNGWKKHLITFGVGQYTGHLPVNTVDGVMSSALDVWARVSPLTFLRSYSQQADIMVEFVRNDHGDSFPFDGPEGTLAHAYGPGEGIGGDVHFDEAESWTSGSKGFNLYIVAAHEFGHALGLKHSQNPESVMYPTYKNRKTYNLLSSEDIININTLYGPRNQKPSPSSRFTWSYPSNPWTSASYFPVSLKETCNPNLTFDAVTTVGEALFFFRDKYLWIKHNNQNDIKEGPISNFMPNIDNKIDAAYWVPQRATAYLFNGTVFWTVKGSRVKGRARNIRIFGFPSWVQQIDAAVHIHRTAHTLFFTQNVYWRYNEHYKSMNDSSPRNISEDFPGLNGPINAAVYKDGFLHFFVGSDVFKYDIKQKEITGADKTSSWLGC